MLATLASAALICAASLLAGRGLMAAFGRTGWTWLEPGLGLAALICVSHVLVRLPGRAVTALVLIAVALVAAGIVAQRHGGIVRRGDLLSALVLAGVMIALAAIPFILAGRVGVLGEGVYSNDQAVHLYWADWLQHGDGDRPVGLGYGYPVGPHAVVAVTAATLWTNAENAFNGLLLAIPALTALTALGFTRSETSPLRRFAVALVAGLPYLAASFLAQSSFKETAIALFLLTFALILYRADRGDPGRSLIAAAIVLVPASVLTFSFPGPLWFALAGAIWLVLRATTGDPVMSRSRVAEQLARWRTILVAGAVLIAGAVAIGLGELSNFIDRVGDVQQSTGRLTGRLAPWEVLGIWPEGDFRIATPGVDGAVVAAIAGVALAVFAFVWLVRRRELALIAASLAAFVVFAGSHLFAEIHVEAKALAIAAPLAALVIARSLLERDAEDAGRWHLARTAAGAAFVILALGSTLLALRVAPVGSTPHVAALEEFRDEVRGKDVIFLSLDRFAPYRLRGADSVRSPGGYVPDPLGARDNKPWVQSDPIDFDSVQSGLLDKADFVVTTAAAYQSSAPSNFRLVDSNEYWLLWKRQGETERRLVLDTEAGDPGAKLTCSNEKPTSLPEGAGPNGAAGVLPGPVLATIEAWKPRSGFIAPGAARSRLHLTPGTWAISLQYNSEVPLSLTYGAESAELPPALDGFYAFAPGRGPFWPVGEITVDEAGTITFAISADEPDGLEGLVEAPRRVYLGDLAAMRIEPGAEVAFPEVTEKRLRDACGDYVDWVAP
jgi:hypothetical protein